MRDLKELEIGRIVTVTRVSGSRDQKKELERMGVAADRLTSEERLQIIAALDEGGIFLFTGAVKDVAAELHCSQASV